jgi:hypothetical protein
MLVAPAGRAESFVIHLAGSINSWLFHLSSLLPRCPANLCAARLQNSQAGLGAGCEFSTLSDLQDVRSDPTLPRTKDVRCPACQHNEAVFFSAHTEEVRLLYFAYSHCQSSLA